MVPKNNVCRVSCRPSDRCNDASEAPHSLPSIEILRRTLAGCTVEAGGTTGYQEAYQEVAGSLVKIKVTASTARVYCGWKLRPLSEKAEDLLEALSAEQARGVLESSQQADYDEGLHCSLPRWASLGLWVSIMRMRTRSTVRSVGA